MRGSGIGVRVSGFGPRVSGLGFRVSGLGPRVSDKGEGEGIRHAASGILHHGSRSPIPDARYPIVVLALVLFTALSAQNITLPGLYYDEALDVVPAMQLLQGAPVEPVRGAGVTIARRTFPLMVMDYVGTVNTYLALPIFAVLGVHVTPVRLLPILLAGLTLVLGYVLAAELFDWRVAAITVLLLAVDPSFVFFSRMGIHVTSVMSVCAVGSLVAFLRGGKTGRQRWLAVGGLLLGIGLWAKVLFLWWIVALGLGWAVLGLESRRHGGREPRGNSEAGIRAMSAFIRVPCDPPQCVVAAAGFLLGAWPLLAYNAMTGGTLISLTRNALVTEYGVSNLDVGRNLVAALDSFRVFLEGSYFWFLGGQFANSLNVVGFVAGVAACVVLLRRKPAWQRPFALVCALIAVVVAESAFTVSGIWPTHLYILFPLPQMVMAVGIVLAAEAIGQRLDVARRWLVTGIMVVAVTAGMVTNLRVDAAYHAALTRSGGLSRFSDAIYGLASWLDERQIAAPYAVDWGIQKSVQILTQGRVNPVEISGFSGEPAEAFVARAEQALRDPTGIYIFHSKEDTVYELYPAFQATADRLGVRIKIIEAFYDRSGAPVHVIWARE